MTYLAESAVRLRQPAYANRVHALRHAGNAPWLGVLVIAWMFTSIKPMEWVAILGALSVASLLYLATRSRRMSRVADAP